MKKIVTMTLNPCIDKTIYFDTFKAGATNIVKRTMEEVAGKGINVAVGLRHLNAPVKAMGFAYKEDADKLYKKLEDERVAYSFVEVDGRLRVNRKLFDESKAEMTECNEKGCPVTKEDMDALLTLLQTELADTSVLVLSGSVPPGVDADIYAVMTAMAKKTGVKVILDASGELLMQGVKAGPYLIKPNREEFVKTFLTKQEPDEDNKENISPNNMETNVTDKARELFANGLRHICMSMGEEGAMFITPKEPSDKEKVQRISVDRYAAVPVTVRSLQGAGDAMVAGIAKAIFEDCEDKMPDYALKMAASTIMLEGTQMGTMEP